MFSTVQPYTSLKTQMNWFTEWELTFKYSTELIWMFKLYTICSVIVSQTHQQINNSASTNFDKPGLVSVIYHLGNYQFFKIMSRLSDHR
jgi:hypothetical protein